MGKGTKKLFTGAGNYNYFIREDGSVFSIMETTLWDSTRDFIFPRLPVDENRFNIDGMPLTENEIQFRTLNQGTKYGMTILYELGEEEGIERIESDAYTMFLYREDGTLWYWNSGAIKYHDNKYAMSNSEIYGEDYQGGFEEVDLKKILGIDDKEEYIPKIVDMCAGSENVLFLTNDGQVFVSEYVTSEIKDVEYYILRNTNPNRLRTGWIYDLQLKKINFYQLDWENIISINTNGKDKFSAVDDQGMYFYLNVTENLMEIKQSQNTDRQKSFVILLTITCKNCMMNKVERLRRVAQLGRALRSGRRSRRFKSCHADYLKWQHTCVMLPSLFKSADMGFCVL